MKTKICKTTLALLATFSLSAYAAVENFSTVVEGRDMVIMHYEQVLLQKSTRRNGRIEYTKFELCGKDESQNIRILGAANEAKRQRRNLRLDYQLTTGLFYPTYCVQKATVTDEAKQAAVAIEDRSIKSIDQLGLPAPYNRVVAPGEPCDINKDVVVTNERYSNGIFPSLISKCDSTRIGWVSVTINAGTLVPDTVLGAGSTNPDPYDLRLLLGIEDLHFNALERFVLRHTMNEGPKGYINIYTCGDSRIDELNKQPLPEGYSTDAKANFEKLMAASKAGKTVRLDLYFNEWVMSGKCIGSIQILD